MYSCSGLAPIVGWKGHIIRYLPGHVPSQYGLLANLRKEWGEEEGDVLKIWVILWSLIMGYHRKEYIAPGRGGHQTGRLGEKTRTFIHSWFNTLNQNEQLSKQTDQVSIHQRCFSWDKDFLSLATVSQNSTNCIDVSAVGFVFSPVSPIYPDNRSNCSICVCTCITCMSAADLDGTTWIWHSGEQSRQSLSAAFSSHSCHSLW